MVGGVTGVIANGLTGAPVSATAVGAAAGAVAGGTLSAAALLGTVAAGSLGGVAGLAAQAYANGLVNSYCQSRCGQ